MRGTAPCPCSSGRSYADCCRPFHAGAAPPSVEALMRSRYSAFALGAVDYLVETTHPSHPDAGAPREDLVASLRRVTSSCRYPGLVVLDARSEGDEGQVLFRARVFQKGKDLSFTELSDFARDDGKWKYVAGQLVDGAWQGLTIAAVPGTGALRSLASRG